MGAHAVAEASQQHVQLLEVPRSQQNAQSPTHILILGHLLRAGARAPE